jgi:transposase
MSKTERRIFSREFRLKVVERLKAGESGTALALALSVKRTIIYRWRDASRAGGAEGGG